MPNPEPERILTQEEFTAAKIAVLKRLVWAGWIEQLDVSDVMDVKIVPTPNGTNILKSIKYFFDSGAPLSQVELVAFLRVVKALEFT